MTGSTSTPDLRGWFKAQRHEPAGDDFTETLMRNLPPKAPLLPALAAAVSLAAGLLICAITADWESLAGHLLHATATAIASAPALALRLNDAALHDLLPALAVGMAAFYLVAAAAVAILASTLKLRIF